jgi:tetratricopeptide (TPR) repeat protein
MKKIKATLLLVLIGITFSFAQKSKLQSAINYFKAPYQQYDKALEAIDEAILHEQTGNWSKTWYYRGLIYMALFESESYKRLCNNCLATSYESFSKALELDPKNEWADEIKSMRIPYISYHTFSTGIDFFRDQKYSDALAAFEFVQEISPEDTSAILNSAYCAEKSGQKDKAFTYYQKLIDMKYNDLGVYNSYAELLKNDKQMEKALGVIRAGRKIYPDTLSLMLTEINLLLSTERNKEATEALDAATAKDPNNPSLYLALGGLYDNMANPRDPEGNELPKPDKSSELITKAELAYKKGLEFNPDSYELNYNLGALYYNQAAEMVNASAGISDNSLFDKAKKAYEQKFRDAQPHLEKAMEFNQKTSQEDINIYESTITSLKEVYVRLKEMEKYERIKNLLEK